VNVQSPGWGELCNVKTGLVSVKIHATMVTVTSHATYHHGDLPNALRAAAAEVIDDVGLGAFSLREVARRAGVSHAAPAHHFGDTKGLVTSLAIEGFETLTSLMLAAQAGIDSAEERLAAIGRVYVEFGGENPGHAAVMFRSDLVRDELPELRAAGVAAFEVLERALKRLRDDHGATFDLGDATKLCWATMQGLVQLRGEMEAVDELRGVQSAGQIDVLDRLMVLLLNGLWPRA